MAQRFIKGLTNNHLTWVMVDATDFATPESALSAATKIKIWGKLRGATGVNFVSSGAGSLTNDIQHVGPSVLGIYTIALVKADLSDASAAWYDQYVISLSATGAAYQTLIVDGGIIESSLSDLASNAYSAAVIAASRALIAQSGASDAASAAAQANSRILIVQSSVSDLQSYVVVMSGILSDTYSLLSDHHSDFQSRVPKLVATNSQLSDLHSDLRSYLVVMSGVQSDIYSAMSDMQSDFQSRVPKRVATDSQLSDLHSDIRSYLVGMSDMLSNIQSELSDTHSDLGSKIGGVTATLSVSDISDIASAVWATPLATKIVQMSASDISDLRSAIAAGAAATVTASDISDIASAVWANAIGARVDSRVLLTQSFASDAASAAQQTNSRVLLNQSRISDIASYLVVMSGIQSDIYSALSDMQSDFQSRVPKRVATDSQLSDMASDIKSAIAGITVTVDASAASDIASAVWAHAIGTRVDSRILVGQSFLSDILSTVRGNSDYLSKMSDVLSNAYSAAAIGASRALLIQSSVSDIQSYLVVMSGILSDAYSAAVVIQSGASDAASAAAQANSRILLVQSRLSDFDSRLVSDISDIMSALTVIDSRVTVTRSMASDAHSAAALFNTAQAEVTGVPAATATPAVKLGFVYEALRNKVTVTSTKMTFFDDSDVAQWEKDLSDDGTTYTESEGNAIG